MISEAIVGHEVTISDTVNSLTLPFGPGWGGPVKYNNNLIPSARLWNVVAEAMISKKKVDRELLMEEAQRADIYRLTSKDRIIWTEAPRDKDILIEGHVYRRTELQRYRTLLEEFNAVIGKIVSATITKDQILELVRVMKKQDLHLFAAQLDRFYFCPDPERVYSAFGTKDHIRLAVYFKRPSSSGIEINL